MVYIVSQYHTQVKRIVTSSAVAEGPSDVLYQLKPHSVSQMFDKLHMKSLATQKITFKVIGNGWHESIGPMTLPIIVSGL